MPFFSVVQLVSALTTPLSVSVSRLNRRRKAVGLRLSLGIVGCVGLLCGCEGEASSPKSTNVKPAVAEQVIVESGGGDLEAAKESISDRLDEERHVGSSPPVNSTNSSLPQAATSRDDQFAPMVPKVYRRSDNRQTLDPQPLESDGIKAYSSKRCVIVTDIEPEKAKILPAYIDQLYVALTSYFGELPPNREASEFQVTGYIMRDKNKFKRHGLLPADLPSFEHGRHDGYEFWMNDQSYDYYRRHLMLHEATHCFMTCVHGADSPPTWYMEGMAEWFATHRDSGGKTQFAIMNHNEQDFLGLGRVQLIRNAAAAGDILPMNRFQVLQPGEFVKSFHYAQGWAMCQFLNRNPNFSKRFRELSKHRTLDSFQNAINAKFQPDMKRIDAEFALLAPEIENGYDFGRNAIVYSKPETKPTITVKAERGWQSSGIELKQGQTLSITATGQAVLGKTPRPWVSEPAGITIRYSNGSPIGTLQGVILSERSNRFGTIHRLNDAATVAADVGGMLFFRINDVPSERSDNSGHYEVVVRSLGGE